MQTKTENCLLWVLLVLQHLVQEVHKKHTAHRFLKELEAIQFNLTFTEANVQPCRQYWQTDKM